MCILEAAAAATDVVNALGNNYYLDEEINFVNLSGRYR